MIVSGPRRFLASVSAWEKLLPSAWSQPVVLTQYVSACACTVGARQLAITTIPARRARTRSSLGALLPAMQVLTLSVVERVDRYAERLQLQARHLAVDLLRHAVHAVVERLAVLHEVLEAERLSGEVDVHHRARVALARGEVHDAAVGEQVDAAAVLQHVLRHERANLVPLGGEGFEVRLRDL